MTLRRTEIIEWSTTPKELRRIADEMDWKRQENEAWKEKEKWWELTANIQVIYGTNMELKIRFDEGQWQAEQTEDNE